MIHASLYNLIYLLLVTIITILINRYYRNDSCIVDNDFDTSNLPLILLVLFMSFFIGLRPVSDLFFGDMPTYVYIYQLLENAPFTLNLASENIIFDNLIAWWASSNFGYSSFFLLFATLYYTTAYFGLRKLFPNNSFTAYIVFLAAFSTFSYATNGIKAGVAASFFIWAIGYRHNLKICIPLILVSWGFHHSMIMPVAAFVITLFFKNPKLYFFFWGFCLLMALLHITSFAHFFAGATTEHGASYLLGDGTNDGTKGGFRLDFILYSAVPVIIGWYAVFVKQLDLSRRYINLLNLYLCLNGVWMLCMYANFTNRIAYLSWFLYPIVLIYPFLNEDWGENKYQTFSYVMLGHLGFTLFMNIIYYR